MRTAAILRSALVSIALLIPAANVHAGTLKGRVVGPTGAGAARVKVDVGAALTILTDLNGFFTAIVAPGTYDIGLRPKVSSGLAPRMIKGVKVLGITDLGTIKLVAGFTLTGTARDSAGRPVANANVDVYDQIKGGKLFTPKDITGALGAFLVVVPAGTYRVRVKPAKGILLVAVEHRDVIVKAATAAGVFILRTGVRITGTVVDANSGAPLNQVDLDADDALTGQRIITPGDNTNASGRFAMVIPTGLYHLSFDPPVGAPYLGKQTFNVAVNKTMDVGRTGLSRGLLLSGTVTGPTSAPVARANIDVELAKSRYVLYTSNDSSDASGKFVVVVPPGVYRVTAQPALWQGLVGARTAAVTVTANMTLPPIKMATGVAVSGTLTASDNSAEHGASLDVFDPATGEPLVIAKQRSDATGRYKMIVPKGTWNVLIKTRKASLSRVEMIKAIAVSGPRTLDRKLTQVPVFAYLATLGIPTVGQGGPVLATIAFVNPNATAQPTKVSIVLVDPVGTVLPILPPLTLTMPPQAFGVTPGLPVPLPPVSRAWLGSKFRLDLRFEDPVTGLEQDRDQIKVVIR